MIRTVPPDERPVKDPLELKFQKLKAEIHRQLVEGLDISRIARIKPERLRHEVRKLAVRLSADTPEMLNEIERERLVAEVMDEAFGLGPLEGPMNDPTVSDILVNGPREVYLERNGRLEPSPILFADDAHLMQVIQRIAARVGRRIDEMSPMVDARLPDGSRVNAIIPPLSLNGPVLSVRRFGVRLTADDLVANGTMPRCFLDLIAGVVAGRVSTLISGGTGTGKTTLLNTLSAYIPHDERLVSIEDTAELKLQQPHVVRLETRPANLEGVGEVKQRELVRNALRMLQAMNTGHEGSLTTVHANDTRDALTRLEVMVKLAGFELPIEIIRQYIGSAIQVVIQLGRLKGGARKIVRVSEIVGVRRKSYVLRDIFGYRQLGLKDGSAEGEFYATGYEPTFVGRLKSMGIEFPGELFKERIIQ